MYKASQMCSTSKSCLVLCTRSAVGSIVTFRGSSGGNMHANCKRALLAYMEQVCVTTVCHISHFTLNTHSHTHREYRLRATFYVTPKYTWTDIKGANKRHKQNVYLYLVQVYESTMKKYLQERKYFELCAKQILVWWRKDWCRRRRAFNQSKGWCMQAHFFIQNTLPSRPKVTFYHWQ